MKTLLLTAILLFGFAFANAQHEYAPLQEKEISYKDWTYKSIRDGKEVNLRSITAGKKLVLVVYFAPWCPNWKLQAPVVQAFYDKYKDKGLEIVGVGEYDSVDKMKASLETYKITFPAVYESDSTAAKQTTAHYTYRKQTGDNRNWGSPWSIFIEPANLTKSGEILVKKATVVNGELMEAESEAFIREKLGLTKDEKKAQTVSSKSTEVCQPALDLKKP
jgi:peroxiredoxin